MTGLFKRYTRFLPVLITLCSLALMIAAYFLLVEKYYSFLITEKKSQTEAILAPHGENLNNALQRRFSLISGLNAYIQSYLTTDQQFTAKEFEPFSRSLYATFSGIGRISVAPGGVITLEYPLSPGSSLIGMDLIRRSNPLINDPITRSLQSKKIIIQGPSRLEQARMLITARQAIYDQDGLWGLISIDYDLIQIMAEADVTLAKNDLMWGLFSEEGSFIFGDPEIVKNDPIDYRLSLPEGSWYLKAAPKHGWKQSVEGRFTDFRFGLALIISLAAVLVYVWSNQQSRLSAIVRNRTSALQNELSLRAQVEDRLKVNEEKFHSVFNQMSDIAIVFHIMASKLPGSIVEVNDAACKLLGFSRDDLLKLSLLDLELSENRTRLIQRTRETAPSGQGFFETELLKSNGETIPVEIRVKHFRMQDEDVGLIVARDISERIIAKEKLQRANRALRVLLEFNESLIRAESETELLEVLCNILVNTGQYNLAWAGFIDQESGQMVTQIIERSEKALHLNIPECLVIASLPAVTDNSISLPLIIKNKIVGAMGIILEGASTLSDEEVTLLNKLADDISYGIVTLRLRADARQKAEQLRESEALYHELARNIPNGVVMLFDEKLNHILADGLGLLEFGMTPEAVIGKSLQEIFPPDVSQVLRKQYEATLGGKTIAQEIRIHDRDYEVHSSPIKNNRGQIVMGLNLIQDISEHKNLQAAIKHQQEQERMILDSIPARIFFKNFDGKVTWVNKSFQENVGLPSSGILNKYDYEIFPHLNREYLASGEAELAATLQPQYNIIGFSDTGDGRRWFKTDKIPIFDKEGAAAGLIGFSFEITALKNAEIEIQQLNVDLENRVAKRTAELEEKNRELETFSYSVSHDLKAPLRGISGYNQLLLENYSHCLDKEGQDFLFVIRDSVNHMEQLINDLLSYSRMERHALNNRLVNFEEMIEFILAEYGNEIEARNITIERQFLFTHLYSDGEGLAQVLRNLIGNAVKFTRDQPAPLIRIFTEENPESWRMSISDNGIGIDPAFHEKIFEIFQRLENAEDYPGTGVGLAIVRKVVTRLGGRVWVESEKGKGAVFNVEISKGSHGN